MAAPIPPRPRCRVLAGGALRLGRDQQAEIKVVDANAVELASAGYSVDPERGRVTWANPLVLRRRGQPPTPPLVVRDRVEHMTLCTEVQVNGELGISSPLPWDLPAGETAGVQCAELGDLHGRGCTTGSPSGPGISARRTGPTSPRATGPPPNHNSLAYPPLIANRGAIDAARVLVFNSSTSFSVVEEKLGGHRHRHYHHRHGADQPGDEHAVLHHPQGRLG
ncbi:hypothetical protein P4050_00450 [Pseudomonas aeruginosa]|nr:hypothetical protein [Pseudomonas aeruginosa]